MSLEMFPARGRLTGFEALRDASSLAVVRRVLDAPPAPSYYTPSQIMGADFISELPGSSSIAIA